VLINRSHSFTDLTLPLAEQEKQLFDAIDGQRAIRELPSDSMDPTTVRAFFERLWWYDQVVFDASRVSPSANVHEADAVGSCTSQLPSGTLR
jgi:hypothetical protein